MSYIKISNLNSKDCIGCNSKCIDIKSKRVVCLAASVPGYNIRLCPCLDCMIKIVCITTCKLFCKYVNEVNSYITYRAGERKHKYISTILK